MSSSCKAFEEPYKVDTEPVYLAAVKMLTIGHVYRLNELKSAFTDYGRGCGGRTPLMYAAIRGDVKEARNRRGYVQQFDMMGCTALMYAASENWPDVIKVLIMDEKQMRMRCPVVASDYVLTNVTALMVAAANNATAAVAILAEYESGLKETGHFLTALMVAAVTGAVNCVALLADRESGLQDKSGKTALMHALEHSHYSCIEYLRDKEKGIMDADGHSALHIAAKMGHIPSFHAVAQCEAPIYGKDVRAMLLRGELNTGSDKRTELLVHLAAFC